MQDIQNSKNTPQIASKFLHFSNINDFTLKKWSIIPNMQGIVIRKAADLLLRGLQNMSAVALLGARQVGKTTLAKMLTKDIPSIYLDLDDADDFKKLNNTRQFLMQHADKLIILDEIQNYPDLFKILRGVIDENRWNGKKTGQFLLLGSASDNLLRQTSQSLVGRIRYIELAGINALELPDNIPMHQLWLRGGFPDSILANNDTEAMAWLENFIRTYITRDISKFNRKVTATQLRRLWTMMAHCQGETANYNKLAESLDMDNKTVRYYINILCELMLLREMPPYFCNIKKRLVKSSRYYVRDSGVLHRLLDIRDGVALSGHPITGKSWEGFVIENVLSVLPSSVQCYFFRTSAGAEIDLLIETRDLKLWAVEIKHSTAPKVSKHFYRTCEELGVIKKFIIYGGEDDYPMKDDIQVMSLPSFMSLVEKELTI